MAVSDSHREANARWDKQNMTNLAVRLPRAKAERYKELCRRQGTSPNAEFLKLINAALERAEQSEKESI